MQKKILKQNYYHGIEFDADGGAELPADGADESDAHIPESEQIHFEDHGNGSHGQNGRFLFAIESVPVALGRVASVVAFTVGVVTLAVGVVDGIARLDVASLVAIVAVEKAFGIVAFFVANLVLEQFPAADGRSAIGPWTGHAQRAIASVEIAARSVAILVANAVAGLVVTSLTGALNLVAEKFVRNAVGRRFAADSARESRVVRLALLAVPSSRAVAFKSSHSVL